jgi:hypothetical protein
MGAIQGAILGACTALVVLFLWKTLGGEAAKSSSTIPRADKPDATSWNVRSVSLKMAAGALIAAVLAGFSVLLVTAPRGGARSTLTPGLLLGSVIFAAVPGALIAYCLALTDFVSERRASGHRVHPVLRAYFSGGLVSLSLWCVTLFAAGIGGIVFYYSFLSPGVGPAH